MDWTQIEPIQDDDLPSGVDFDKTIAENTGHPLYIPIEGADRFLNKLVELGETIVIHTSRPDADKHKIKAWMEHYNLPFHEISCGKRLFKVYYDDKAVRYEGNWDAIINSL